MLEWVVSSTVLALVVIALRRVVTGRVSLRVQYALWALVLIRLLIPFGLRAPGWSVGGLMRQAAETETGKTVSEFAELALPRMTYHAAYEKVAGEYSERGVDISRLSPDEYEAVDDEILSRMGGGWSVRDILRAVWIAGVAAAGLVMLVSNTVFAVRLRKTRKKLTMPSFPLPVYVSTAADTPCLAGLLRPAVYVTPDEAENSAALRYAAAHELTHYRHGDHIWSLLRGVCLALHWYNPVVWWAAVLSRKDAEFACDESTIRRIGDGERAGYSRALIEMTCRGSGNPLLFSTTMSGSGNSVKERIMLIVRKPKTTVGALIAVILIAAVAAGCTFTTPKDNDAQAPMPDDQPPVADTAPVEPGDDPLITPADQTPPEDPPAEQTPPADPDIPDSDWRDAEIMIDPDGVPYIRYGAEEAWRRLGDAIAPPVEWSDPESAETLAGRDEAASLFIDEGTEYWAQLVSVTDGWLVACYGRSVAAADKYIYKTSDGGRTWVQTNRPDREAFPWHLGAVGFLSPDRLIVSQLLWDDAPCFLTKDGGRTWEKIETPDPLAELRSITVSEGKVTMNFALTDQSQSWTMTSDDLGDTWETTESGQQ